MLLHEALAAVAEEGGGGGGGVVVGGGGSHDYFRAPETRRMAAENLKSQ